MGPQARRGGDRVEYLPARHKDRHASIGEGEIGDPFFARLLTDPRLTEVPMLLETPLGDDQQGHRRDLHGLRTLV